MKCPFKPAKVTGDDDDCTTDRCAMWLISMGERPQRGRCGLVRFEDRGEVMRPHSLRGEENEENGYVEWGEFDGSWPNVER